MRVQAIDLTIGTDTYEGRLNTPQEDTGTGALVLPGAGHGPFGDIFDIIAYELAGDGKHVLRFESWEDKEQLGEKTTGELHDEIDAGIEYLQSRECSTIYLVAKSFGGGLALTRIPEVIDRVVLWEPAIEVVNDPESSTEMSETMTDPGGLGITAQELGQIQTPVRILCGDEEPGLSVESCERMVNTLGQGDMTVIPGENHSFNINRPAIVQHTLEYFP